MIGIEQAVEPGAIPDVSDGGKVMQAFYDAARKCYWVENSRGGWIEFNEQSLKRLLRAEGRLLLFRPTDRPASPVGFRFLESVLLTEVPRTHLTILERVFHVEQKTLTPP